jgi:signal transduction histidine kinase
MMTKAGSFGIIGMQERAALCGGIFSISPAGEKGTLIKVQLPMVGMESAT